MKHLSDIHIKETYFYSAMPRLLGLWIAISVCIPVVLYEARRVEMGKDFSLRTGCFIFLEAIFILALLFTPEAIKNNKHAHKEPAEAEEKLSAISLLLPLFVFMIALPMGQTLRIPHDSWIMGLKYIPKITIAGKLTTMLYMLLGAGLVHMFVVWPYLSNTRTSAARVTAPLVYALRLLAIFILAYSLLPSVFAFTRFSGYVDTAHIRMVLGLCVQGFVIFLLWQSAYIAGLIRKTLSRLSTR